jgi:hypothetical protein
MAHSHTGRRCCTNLACTLKSAYPFLWEMTKRFELDAFTAGDDGLDGASSGHWLKSKAFRKIRCSRKVPLSIEWISSMMSHA